MKNALEVISNVRSALARVTDGSAVTLTREEFETIASACEKRAQPRPSPAKTDAQLTLPAMPSPVFDTGPALPGNLDAAQLRALLVKPKTAKQIARVVHKSPATVKRALRMLPDVALIGTKARARQPGHRPNVYALH